MMPELLLSKPQTPEIMFASNMVEEDKIRLRNDGSKHQDVFNFSSRNCKSTVFDAGLWPNGGSSKRYEDDKSRNSLNSNYQMDQKPPVPLRSEDKPIQAVTTNDVNEITPDALDLNQPMPIKTFRLLENYSSTSSNNDLQVLRTQ